MNKLIANLLAAENLTVVEGAYITASFTPATRILRIPFWCSDNKKVFDMMIGHEVGHALYTPIEGIHEASESELHKLGVNHAMVNIIEDIRIEKLILRRYPGMIVSFREAYRYLWEERDFFAAKETSPKSMHFLDRVNIHYKMRGYVAMPFKKKEAHLIELFDNLETWEDTIDACKEVAKFLEKTKKTVVPVPVPVDHTGDEDDIAPEMPEVEARVEKENEPSPEVDTEASDLDDFEPDDTSDLDDFEPDEVLDMEEDGDEILEEDDEEPKNQDIIHTEHELAVPDLDAQDEDDDEDFDDDEDEDEDEDFDDDSAEPVTLDEFQKNEEILAMDAMRKGMGGIKFVNDVTPDQVAATTISWKDLFEAQDTMINDDRSTLIARNAFLEFKKTNKKFVAMLAREFETRKQAYRYARSQEATVGSINTNKLHAYKYDDNIFNTVTNLADAKSHGMVMTIDYSGSMCGSISDVIRQTMILAMFCQSVRIPFEVWSFTSATYKDAEKYRTNILPYTADTNELIMVNVLNSDMNKNQMEQGMINLFQVASYFESGRYMVNNFNLHMHYTAMGGTPLIESLMVCEKRAHQMRLRHNLENVTIIALTDGEGGQINTVEDGAVSYYNSSNWILNTRHGRVTAKSLKLPTGTTLQVGYLEYLRTMYNVVGFFIADSWSLKRQINDVVVRANADIKRIRKNFRDQGFHGVSNFNGYDRWFLFDGTKRMDVTEKKFDTDATEIKDIRRDFRKTSKSNRKSKMFANEFISMVA